jgi:hypothetical protein
MYNDKILWDSFNSKNGHTSGHNVTTIQTVLWSMRYSGIPYYLTALFKIQMYYTCKKTAFLHTSECAHERSPSFRYVCNNRFVCMFVILHIHFTMFDISFTMCCIKNKHITKTHSHFEGMKVANIFHKWMMKSSFGCTKIDLPNCLFIVTTLFRPNKQKLVYCIWIWHFSIQHN